MPKQLKLKKIIKKNKGIDPGFFAEANRLIGELRAKGLPEPRYGLNSPYVREIRPVEPRIRETEHASKPSVYLSLEE